MVLCGMVPADARGVDLKAATFVAPARCKLCLWNPSALLQAQLFRRGEALSYTLGLLRPYQLLAERCVLSDRGCQQTDRGGGYVFYAVRQPREELPLTIKRRTLLDHRHCFDSRERHTGYCQDYLHPRRGAPRLELECPIDLQLYM